MGRGRQGSEVTVGSITSSRWSWLVAALAAGLVWPALVQADTATHGRTGSSAVAPTAAQGDFAARVAIPGGRRLYLECRGAGSPTVVLEAGTGDRGESGAAAVRTRAGRAAGGRALHPRVRLRPPGHPREPGGAQPQRPGRDAAKRADIVGDLRALLRAARVPGPYVLAGHSFGGMVARLYATTHPRRIAGLVSIDAQNEDFAAAYKELLTPEQYAAAVLNPRPPPGLESYSAIELLDLPASAAQMRQAQADTPLRRMPLVVLSHSRTLPNPFGFPPDWPSTALDRAFQDSQDMLARARAGRPPRDRRPKRALHPARPAQAGDPRDPPGGPKRPAAAAGPRGHDPRGNGSPSSAGASRPGSDLGLGPIGESRRFPPAPGEG